MKQGYKVSLSRSPSSELEELGVENCLQAVGACFMGLRLNLPYVSIPRGLEKSLSGEERNRIASEVRNCSRMVAFLTFNPNQTSLEIGFSSGADRVKTLVIIYDYDSRQLIFSGEANH